ncbi:alpha/beta fold hydrolase [Streptomyces fuscigenes]|uniref:alpha/beta fold hydrolase n=1 Tax=Streptomyces fuscigenes TaxID=1528880 RepID=UPI001F44B35E|nr:alpha/beta hydrolase [Streptomyces fuscigenes]MCF3964143.1 alpha/beta hydrolase [Streptomyces fuscigenes]
MERHLDLPDAHLAYDIEGSGETILLMHGGFSPDWFVPAASRIPDHRLITLQRAGYGGSKDLSGGASVAAHADHAAAVLRAAGARRAHIVGHSAGASVGLQLALAHPDLVGSLILFETAFPYAPEESPMPGMARAVEAAKRGAYEDAFDAFLSSVSGPGYRDAFVRELGEAGLRRAVDNTPYFFDSEGAAFRAWSFGPDEMASVRAPLLLAVGGLGERLGTPHRARSAHLARGIPQAETAVLPGVSHSLPMEDPDLVARTITAFAARHPLGSA